MTPAQIATTWSSIGHGAYCGWLSVATIRCPRASVRCVAGSSSEPNCANASSSRYWDSSSQARRRPSSSPWSGRSNRRDTEMPTFTAGRTPEKKVGLEEDLAVRDRDDVGRDVRGHVPRLRLDQRKRVEEAAAELVQEACRLAPEAASGGRRRRRGTPPRPGGRRRSSESCR